MNVQISKVLFIHLLVQARIQKKESNYCLEELDPRKDLATLRLTVLILVGNFSTEPVWGSRLLLLEEGEEEPTFLPSGEDEPVGDPVLEGEVVLPVVVTFKSPLFWRVGDFCVLEISGSF